MMASLRWYLRGLSICNLICYIASAFAQVVYCCHGSIYIIKNPPHPSLESLPERTMRNPFIPRSGLLRRTSSLTDAVQTLQSATNDIHLDASPGVLEVLQPRHQFPLTPGHLRADLVEAVRAVEEAAELLVLEVEGGGCSVVLVLVIIFVFVFGGYVCVLGTCPVVANS